MPKFEVHYKVLSKSLAEGGSRESFGPSDFTVVVEAPYMASATALVQAQNGGANFCQVYSTIPV